MTLLPSAGSACILLATPATSSFVDRGTLVSVSKNRIDLNLREAFSQSQSSKEEVSCFSATHPRNPFIPPGFPFIALEKLKAPPLTATALSIPLGLP
jgi:hypothetical protein